MAEEFVDDYGQDDGAGSEGGELDVRGNSLGGSEGGDFADGSTATGAGRGDPGVDPSEFERLRTENERLSERARVLDDFERDPQRVIRDVANRMGLDLVPKQGQGQQQSRKEKPPQEYVDRISENLPPEMQFMAESLAQASWVANQESLRPYQEQQTQERMRQRQQEIDAIAADMDSKHPSWRRSLTDMEQLYNFLSESANGGPMRHPRFGSVQEALYKLVSGGNTGERRAAERQREAARHASSVGENGQNTGEPDIQTLIGKEKDQQKRWRMAFNNALSEHGAKNLWQQ